jgi:hypothetical protein
VLRYGTSWSVTQRLNYIKDQIAEDLKILQKQAKKQPSVSEQRLEEDEYFLGHNQVNLREYKRISSYYFPKPYHGKITLIWRESVKGSRLYPHYLKQWQTLSRETEEHVVPGAHNQFLVDHIDKVAQTLQDCLRRAQDHH